MSAQFTRKEMAQLLLSLRDQQKEEALSVVKNVLSSNRTQNLFAGAAAGGAIGLALGGAIGGIAGFFGGKVIANSIPPILEKLINLNGSKADVGFSLSDIVALGNQMESVNLSVTTVQNWVKRDVKELIATPQAGKKYSLEQTAAIFIIEDLKSALDFESIRKLMTLIFNDPNSDEDDVIHPVDFMDAYATIFEELRNQGTPIEEIAKRADEYVNGLTHLNDEQRDFVRGFLIIAVLCLQAANYQAAAKTVASTTLLSKQLN